MNAVQMLMNDHLRVQGLFRRFEMASGRGSRPWLDAAHRALIELEIHSRLEEEIFYPALAGADGGSLKETVQHSVREHEAMDRLLAELHELDPDGDEFEATFYELMDMVEQHMAEEENEVLPAATAQLGGQLDDIGVRMVERRREIIDEVIARDKDANALLMGQRLPQPAPATDDSGPFAVGSLSRPTDNTAAPDDRGPFAVAPIPRRTEPAASQRSDILVGMIVLGQDGKTIGRVKEVGDGEFLVDRMLARDIYVPFSAVELVDGQAVALSINSSDMDNMGWRIPPLIA